MTGVSTLGQALAQIERIKDQQTLLGDLSTQLATGKKTQKFSGLGRDILSLQRARTNFASLDTYVNNINNADRRINLTLNAVNEFKAQAENFANALQGFSQQSAHQLGDVVYFDDPLTTEIENTPIGQSSATPDIDFRTLQDLANNVFDLFVDLLNAKDEERFLLNGSDSANPPILDTGLLDSALSGQIDDWKAGTITTQDFIANLQDRTIDGGNTDAITDTVAGYSAALSSELVGNVFVRVDDTSEIDYTVFANDQGFRDVLVAAAYFKNEGLPPITDHVEIDATTGLPNVLTEGAPGLDADEQKENFYSIFNDLTVMVNVAIDNIDQQRFKLESARAQIDSIKSSHQEEQNVLLSTISDIEDADINEVAVQLNSLQVQIDASFRVTARIQQLSLVNFI